MIEYPEGRVYGEQIRRELVGKQVSSVFPPTKEHKFCWFTEDPAKYKEYVSGAKVTDGNGFGIYIEMSFDNGWKLNWNDGVNARLYETTSMPKDYQLAVEFTDDTALVFSVAMYGSINLHHGDYLNEYYLTSLAGVDPLGPDFSASFDSKVAESKESLSCKALLATEQRFPGIGNGVTQDILFEAGLLPRRKVSTLSDEEKENLKRAVVTILGQMKAQGGRDTEKDLFGNPGGYQTKMSKKGFACGCPKCGGPITKENYLGGSVYYCKQCQK